MHGTVHCAALPAHCNDVVHHEAKPVDLVEGSFLCLAHDDVFRGQRTVWLNELGSTVIGLWWLDLHVQHFNRIGSFVLSRRRAGVFFVRGVAKQGTYVLLEFLPYEMSTLFLVNLRVFPCRQGVLPLVTAPNFLWHGARGGLVDTKRAGDDAVDVGDVVAVDRFVPGADTGEPVLQEQIQDLHSVGQELSTHPAIFGWIDGGVQRTRRQFLRALLVE